MFNESDTMVRRTILNDLAKKKRIFNSTKFFLFNYRKKSLYGKIVSVRLFLAFYVN